MSARRNEIAHRNRKNRRIAAGDRRSGHQNTSAPIFAGSIRLTAREARMAGRCAAEMDTAATYRPIE